MILLTSNGSHDRSFHQLRMDVGMDVGMDAGVIALL